MPDLWHGVAIVVVVVGILNVGVVVGMFVARQIRDHIRRG